MSKTDGGSNGPLLCGKQTTFEGGVREPAIAWWPTRIKSNSIIRWPVSMMDLFATILKLTGQNLPSDREYDSNDLAPVLFNNSKVDSTIYYYRGNQLMAIRSGEYKAHFWTFTNPWEEYNASIDFCPSQFIKGITTHNLTNHTKTPKLFHLGRDPGKK